MVLARLSFHGGTGKRPKQPAEVSILGPPSGGAALVSHAATATDDDQLDGSTSPSSSPAGALELMLHRPAEGEDGEGQGGDSQGGKGERAREHTVRLRPSLLTSVFISASSPLISTSSPREEISA